MSTDEDQPDGQASESGADLIAGHVLAYAALLSAQVDAWQRSVMRRLVGAAIAITGIAMAALILTIGIIAAAWPTDHRWLTLLLVAAFHMLVGAAGIWLLVSRSDSPSPAGILIDELRKDMRLAAAAIRSRFS